jgi:hypothetical protein
MSFFLMTIKPRTFVSYTFFVNSCVALTPILNEISTLKPSLHLQSLA